MNWKDAVLTLNRPKVMGQLRHLIGTIGTFLATKGAIDGASWEIYTGIGLAILAFIGSLLASEKQ